MAVLRLCGQVVGEPSSWCDQSKTRTCPHGDLSCDVRHCPDEADGPAPEVAAPAESAGWLDRFGVDRAAFLGACAVVVLFGRMLKEALS